jgi:SAM-dependent methyltransferase
VDDEGVTPFDGRPAWLLDETATIGRENLDEAHVARYDDKEDAEAADEVRLLRDELALGADAVVVDLGAGTGQFTLAAAAAFGRVVAVDPSPVMLGRLRAKVAAGPPRPNLEIVEAGFLTYDHTGVPADLVYSRYALHHLPDFWKAVALSRMRAMFGPGSGGVVRLWDVVYSFDAAEAEERIERWCASYADDADGDGSWVRADLEEHVRDEHSTFTWLLEPMIERAGFDIRRVEHSDDGFFASYLLDAR